MTKSASVKKTSKFQLTDSTVTGTLFIILSGIILFSDKIFTFYNIELSNLHGFNNTSAFVWTFSQTIAPLLIIVGAYLNAYKNSYIIPLFCYTLQMYFVLDTGTIVDEPMFWVYVIGTMMFITTVAILIKKAIKNRQQKRELKTDIMQKIIDVDDTIIAKIEKK